MQDVEINNYHFINNQRLGTLAHDSILGTPKSIPRGIKQAPPPAE